MEGLKETGIKIDISKYAQGIYYVRAINETGQTQTLKLMKE